jgi:hypothetical protein
MEAPEVNGSIATLARYAFSPPAGTGDFDGAGVLKSTVSSGTPTYTAAGLNYANDSGVMIQNGAQVSTPGDPDTALTAFNAAYGSSIRPHRLADSAYMLGVRAARVHRTSRHATQGRNATVRVAR